MKISIIGAENIGTMVALFLKQYYYGSRYKVVLLDEKLGLAEGKALDISQIGEDYDLVGVTSNYEMTKNSDFIIITSESPWKSDMSIEEFISVNKNIVKGILDKSFIYSPKAKFIIVSNPVDTMTYFAVKYLGSKGVPSDNIFGFGNDLDVFRLEFYLKALNIKYSDAYVIGGHGAGTMIPIVEADSPVDKDKLRVAKEQTKAGENTITSLLGTSASITPGYVISLLMRFVSGSDYNLTRCCSVYDPISDACYGMRLTNINGKICRVVCPVEYQKDLDESISKIKKVNSLLHV